MTFQLRRIVLLFVLLLGLVGAGWWYANGTDNRVWALQANSGEVTWSATMAPDIKWMAARTVANGQLFAWVGLRGDEAGTEPSAPMQLLALDAANGQERWRYTPPSTSLNGSNELRFDEMVTDSYVPLVIDDMVLVVAGFRDEDGNTHSELAALDLANGQERWRLPDYSAHDLGLNLFTPPVVLVGNELLVLQYRAGQGLISWVDPRTGQLLRSVPQPFEISYSRLQLRFNGELVLVDIGGEVHALDPGTGALLYSVTLEARDVVLAGDNFYVTSYGNSELNALLAYDAATGQERWRSPLPSSRSQFHYLVAEQSHVYVLMSEFVGADALPDEQFSLVALDAANGAERWRVPLGPYAAEYQRPVLAGDTIHLLAESTQSRQSSDAVWAYNASDGTPRWQFARYGGGSIFRRVAGDQGLLFTDDSGPRWRAWPLARTLFGRGD